MLRAKQLAHVLNGRQDKDKSGMRPVWRHTNSAALFVRTKLVVSA